MLETTSLYRWQRNFKWSSKKFSKNTITKSKLFSMRLNQKTIKVIKVVNKTLSNRQTPKLKLQRKTKLKRNLKNSKGFKQTIYPNKKQIKKTKIKINKDKRRLIPNSLNQKILTIRRKE